MKSEGTTLLAPYRAALRRHLKSGPAARLASALKLGRQAVALGLDTLDMALIHEQALIGQIPSELVAGVRNRMIKKAREFFAEAIVAMEATHRSAIEAKARMIRMKRDLTRRTADLAASNRQLQKEISRRKTMEETLRKSERHSSRLLADSRQLQSQLKHLSRRILLAQEEERKRISRELHDVIAQMLTGINIRLSSLKRTTAASTKGLNLDISRTQRMVEKSVDRVHQFARELRPAVLDDLGLAPALHSYLKNFAKQAGVHARINAFAGLDKITIAKRTVLYRVAQEALTNVACHAQASRVEVDIQRIKSTVRMEIRDNGKGFDVAQAMNSGKIRHLGLLGMRERVEMVRGKFAIESVSGKGTLVQADIPFYNDKKNTRQS